MQAHIDAHDWQICGISTQKQKMFTLGVFCNADKSKFHTEAEAYVIRRTVTRTFWCGRASQSFPYCYTALALTSLQTPPFSLHASCESHRVVSSLSPRRMRLRRLENAHEHALS
jgi:hypothetical protein